MSWGDVYRSQAEFWGIRARYAKDGDTFAADAAAVYERLGREFDEWLDKQDQTCDSSSEEGRPRP